MAVGSLLLNSRPITIVSAQPRGKKRLIAMLKESDLFGGIGLIDGLPRLATVTALETCRLRVLFQ